MARKRIFSNESDCLNGCVAHTKRLNPSPGFRSDFEGSPPPLFGFIHTCCTSREDNNSFPVFQTFSDCDARAGPLRRLFSLKKDCINSFRTRAKDRPLRNFFLSNKGKRRHRFHQQCNVHVTDVIPNEKNGLTFRGTSHNIQMESELCQCIARPSSSQNIHLSIRLLRQSDVFENTHAKGHRINNCSRQTHWRIVPHKKIDCKRIIQQRASIKTSSIRFNPRNFPVLVKITVKKTDTFGLRGKRINSHP